MVLLVVKKKTHHRVTRSYTEKNTPWFFVFSVVRKSLNHEVHYVLYKVYKADLI